ncbi:uncharacterized protein Triagg1_6039 [Trichoderma aggressivum f. europaeum]|uniref:Uncharacterized protein n=1 Tax=Trichoderma aggressivum f. europaeum TaxID=173218 RepID=A0AAE1LXW3_9HYPO|nr:hypothetical protein Triagg1_6039 [Trichoderma aggressivum f. europaeum]
MCMASIWLIRRRIESPVSKLLIATTSTRAISPPPSGPKQHLGSYYQVFYVLVATAVFARKLDWIKSAALSTALPLSASAAVHGIVLAAVHRDKAVDMDIYGAFQMCAIGTLVVPLMIKLSRSHEYSTYIGRRIMFMWAGLVLTGLVCLAIEFFRAQTFACHENGQGSPISSNPRKFPYGENTTCELVCSEIDGPLSPIRIGSANNIYVIPAPRTLTFGAATLVAAGCCIHTIIWMVVMTERFGIRAKSYEINKPISGSNDTTKGTMNETNLMVHLFLYAAAVPVSGCAAVAIIVVGEINFFSSPVSYQAEPLASIGQWSTLVGTGLAALGSLYILLARDGDVASQEPQPDTNHDGIGCQHCCEHGSSHGSFATNASSRDGDEASQTGIHMGAMSGGRGSPPLLESNGSSNNGNEPDSSAARITKASAVSPLEAS